jgi:hypothetical protein
MSGLRQAADIQTGSRTGHSERKLDVRFVARCLFRFSTRCGHQQRPLSSDFGGGTFTIAIAGCSDLPWRSIEFRSSHLSVPWKQASFAILPDTQLQAKVLAELGETGLA